MQRDVSVTPILSTRHEGDPPPLISVAISTYQRAEMLPRLFDALAGQTLPKKNFEVVIVDNGSSDDSAEVIQKLGEASGLRIHALRVDINRGPTPARNLAWQEALAPVVAFTDDDCAPAPGWLEHGLGRMSEKDTVLVGCTLPDPDFKIGPFSRTIRVTDVNWLPTCNVFYLRSDLESVGGFDERYSKPGGEDTDLAMRVRDACDREFRFDHSALVYHDVRPSRFMDAAKETQRWVDNARLFRSHPDARYRLHRRIFWKPSHPKVILAVIGLAFAPFTLVSLVLTLPWLYYRTRVRKAPGRRRHKYTALPGTFVVDLFETIAMVRGSIRHRTLIL